MRPQFSVGGFVIALMALLAGLFIGLRFHTPAPAQLGSAAERLQPVSNPPAGLNGATVYVPVYSSLPLGLDIKQQTVELSATVSVRNVSQTQAIVIEWVRYYDSLGVKVREYLDQPAQLAPLASVEFVVRRADTKGGPGANFLIHWRGPAQIDEPLIEAVMTGKSGNAGISFTSAGRTTKESGDKR
jgi:hypothetical protein